MSHEWRSCTRKLRHPDFLSAMKHIRRFPHDENLVIYPCVYCGGLHIGHPPKERATREPDPPRNSIEGRIRRTRLRLARAKSLNPRLHKFQQQLSNRQRIASLEANLNRLLAEQQAPSLAESESQSKPEPVVDVA